MSKPFLFVSGWKMNLTTTQVDRYLVEFLELADVDDGRDVLFLPSFTALETTREHLSGTSFRWGAQDIHPDDAGGHTGDISGPMLADLGCSAVMVGHAERRRDHGEDDELITRKIAAARRWDIEPLVCVGDAERGSLGEAIATVTKQLEVLDDCVPPTVVAYEPLWAIGSGTTASTDWIEGVHAGIADWLTQHRPGFATDGVIAYGGSVHEASAASVIQTPGVQGLFVGSASNSPTRFRDIVAAPLR